MNEELAFLHAITGKPKDATARLVEADWLEENHTQWEAAAVRYFARLEPADREAPTVFVISGNHNFKPSPLAVFGCIDPKVINLFPKYLTHSWRKAKTTPPEFFPAMRRLKRYVVRAGDEG